MAHPLHFTVSTPLPSPSTHRRGLGRPANIAVAFALALFAAGCDSGADDEDGSSTSAASETGSVADPDCDALLTPADFAAVCGAELTLEPSAFEGIELNPCNRAAANNEAILLVTRHPDAATANAAAEVAGGRGPNLQTDVYASAGAASLFAVEVKATADASAVCSPESLPMLLDLALGRILP